MNVLIVDDEPLARKRLARLLEQLTAYQIVAEAENGEQAIDRYKAHNPDIILMDVRMPVMDGLAAARYIANSEQPPALIFCTAYDDYALDAFDANAVDYLLKPVNREKLVLALEKAQKLNRVQLSTLTDTTNETSHEQAKKEQRSHICAKSNRGMELVPLTEVRFFLADQKYVTVYYVSDGRTCEVLIDDSLKDLESEFSDRFVRVHRNALVAKAHIQGLERSDDGAKVKLTGMTLGPHVSRRHMPSIRKLLQCL